MHNLLRHRLIFGKTFAVDLDSRFMTESVLQESRTKDLKAWISYRAILISTTPHRLSLKPLSREFFILLIPEVES